VEGSCVHGNDPSVSIKCWEILKHLHNLRLLKNGSFPSSQLVSFNSFQKEDNMNIKFHIINVWNGKCFVCVTDQENGINLFIQVLWHILHIFSLYEIADNFYHYILSILIDEIFQGNRGPSLENRN
jgi:hypothetical protein